MSPVTVRYTPTKAELNAVRAALSNARQRLPLPMALALSALFLVQGIFHVAYPRGDAFFTWMGYVQIAFGVVYVPLAWASRRARLSLAQANREIEFRIDDGGITVAELLTSIPWSEIKTVLDVGDAFVFERSWARRFAILKRAMPDDGRALWTALDAKLTATRYLVRGTGSQRRISNGLLRG